MLDRARLAALALAVTALAACGGPPASVRDARDHLRKGDAAGAKVIVDRELARSPRDATLWGLRITVNLALGDMPAAQQAYRDYRATGGEPQGDHVHVLAETVIQWSLRAKEPELRIAAIQAAHEAELARLNDIIAPLMSDPDDTVRAAAASAVNSGAAHELLARLLGSESARARASALRGLGDGGREAAQRLLVADPDAGVRTAAAGVLGGARKSADRPLLEGAAADKDPGVRAAALRALVRLKDVASLPVARQHLGDPYLGAQLAALQLLDAAGGKGVVPELRVLATGKDAAVVVEAAALLWQRGDHALAEKALSAALAAPQWNTRAAAVNATLRLSHTVALAFATVAANDAELAVRLTAARALLTSGGKDRAMQLLAAAVADKSGDPFQRAQAAVDLARRHDDAAVTLLETLAAGGEGAVPEVQMVALDGLGDLGKPRDALVYALIDKDPRVRLAAAGAALRSLR